MNTASASVAKTATVQARVSPALKKSAVRVFRRHNLTLSQAINLFLQQTKARGDVPLDRNPGEKMLKSMREVDAGRGLVKCEDAKDMFRKLGI